MLAGGGPDDVVELTVRLAQEMLEAAGIRGADPAAALKDGRAMDVWRRMISAQGGDPDAALPVARESEVVYAPADGVLVGLDAMAVGVAAWRLGAGRARKEDIVQAGAGVRMHAKPGALVRAGEPLMTLLTDTPEKFERAKEALEGAVTIAPGGFPPGSAADHRPDQLTPVRAEVGDDSSPLVVLSPWDGAINLVLQVDTGVLGEVGDLVADNHHRRGTVPLWISCTSSVRSTY